MAKSLTSRINALIAQGKTNKEIIAKLKCKPQAVYNARYYAKKTATKPKRKYVRKTITPIAMPIMTEVIAPTPAPTLWQRIKNFFAD